MQTDTPRDSGTSSGGGGPTKQKENLLGEPQASQPAPEVGGWSDLAVCDIIGDWGTYQWSLTLFAVLYSALASFMVVVGPIWTPDLSHICRETSWDSSQTGGLTNNNDNNNDNINTNISSLRSTQNGNLRQCFGSGSQLECSQFLYDDANYGRVLTNTFDLVCSRKWQRSFLSSSALIGMLISSVTLGVFSDKFGRIACVRWGGLLGLLATLGALLSPSFLWLNVCVGLMSYSQVGVANALSTLVMESTSPRFRYVAVFEYCIGWGSGMIGAPLIHLVTMDYKRTLVLAIVYQLLLAIWFRFGVFESIRWLLSEGHISRAQIELRRACRMNRMNNDQLLAKQIAQMQVQQVRKASHVIEAKLEPLRSQIEGQMGATGGGPLDQQLSSAVRRSISGRLSMSLERAAAAADSRRPPLDAALVGLSETLVRKSFSVIDPPQSNQQGASSSSPDGFSGQALAHLALTYGKALQEQEEGGCFAVQMFHPKLARLSTVLVLVSVMLETAYYGLVTASGFIGDDVTLNYVTGGLTEWLAGLLFMVILWLVSRRAALIVPILVASAACFGIAATYQLIPGYSTIQQLPADTSSSPQDSPFINGSRLGGGGFMLRDGVVAETGSNMANSSGHSNLAQINAPDQSVVELRETINFYFMILGRFSVSVGIQVAATVAMEAYPNNLRQTGPGAILIVGRLCSVLSPFLFSDHSADKLLFKITLVVIGLLGLLISILVPWFVRDNKGKELCDRLNDIQDH